VVFLFVLNRKTTRLRDQWMLARYFLTRAATPPCGDARRGISSLACNSFPSFATLSVRRGGRDIKKMPRSLL